MLALAAAFAPLLFSCRRQASPAECLAMIDHYIELALREAPNGPALSPAQAEAVREVERGLKRAEPTYRKVQDHCQEITRAEASCALGADTTKAWTSCVHPSDGGR